MAASIDEKRRDVQAAFAAVYRRADEGEPSPLAVFEPALWTEMLALGRALMALWIARCAARPRLARYEHDGRTYEVVGSEAGEVGTRFGKVAYEAPVGRVVGWKRAARDLPLDRELGLCGGFSLLAVTTLVRLCAQMAFASARKTFGDVFEWSPSQRATLRMVDGVGTEARPFLDQAPPPKDDGEVLVIQVDGKGAKCTSSTTFLGELEGTPDCAKMACAISWLSAKKTVKFQRAGDAQVDLTGAFPFDWRQEKVRGRVARVQLDGAHGTLRCNGDGGLRDRPIQGLTCVWPDDPDHPALMQPLQLEGGGIGVTLQSSGPPDCSVRPTAASHGLAGGWTLGAGALAGGGVMLAGLTTAFALMLRWRGRARARGGARLVLHLSDLHFGTAENAAVWCSQLVADLQDNLGCKRVDAVILSGDVANVSTPEEYEAARAFVEQLCGELHVSRERVIPVPGNHDLDWKRAKAAYRAVPGAPLRPDVDFEEGSVAYVRDDAAYPGRFAPFAAFYEAVRGEPYPIDPAAQAIVYPLPALGILVLGLNSAWKLDHHFKARADVHAVALAAALDRIRRDPACKGLLKMAVWHHPVHSAFEDRITDHGFLQRLADAGFRLSLHGHVHKADNALFRYDMGTGGRRGRRLEIVTAGTFGAPVREWVPGYPLQYQLLRFEGSTLTVETRRREELNGAWKPDARWTPPGGRDPLPRYTLPLG